MKNQIFDLFHISYILVSLGLTVLILWLAKKYIKTAKSKNIFLKVSGIITVFLHLSPLWVDYLKDGNASVADNMLFPIYFCNLAMILLLMTSFIEDKNSKFFKYLAITTSYAGILGSIISLFYPEYYLYAEGLSFGVVKSMLSHSTMLIGCLYLMIGNYFKVERKNAIVFLVGLLCLGFIGLCVNIIFVLSGQPNPNAMYLQRPPLEEIPFLNGPVIGGLLIGTVFLIGYIRELKLSKKNSEAFV